MISKQLTLGLVLVCVGCGRAAVEARDEDRPAPPCSINGMLFRDTPATDFERCGRTDLPITGDARKCIEAAIQAQRPFVVELETPRPVPPHRQPAIAGAEFDGRYQLRSYLVSEAGKGERSEIELFVDSERSGLSLRAGAGPVLRCVQSRDRPAETESGWRTIDARHEFHAARCLEWFDDEQWRRQPWNSSFDGSVHLECRP